MTDRIKGFLVTIEGDLRDDDAEHVVNALKMIRRVKFVKPYVKGMEDYMMESSARHDVGNELMQFVREKCYGIKDAKNT